MAKDNIRNVIRRLRFDHNEMTQQELADRVSVTRQTIIALESGKYGPSLSLAFRIARVFGVTVEGVFQYDGDVDSTNPHSPSGQRTPGDRISPLPLGSL